VLLDAECIIVRQHPSLHGIQQILDVSCFSRSNLQHRSVRAMSNAYNQASGR